MPGTVDGRTKRQEVGARRFRVGDRRSAACSGSGPAVAVGKREGLRYGLPADESPHHLFGKETPKMHKLNAVLAVSVACAVLSACTQSPTALTPDAAPRLDGGHTFGPGHNAAPGGGHTLGSGGITSADGGHGFGSGHLTGE